MSRNDSMAKWVETSRILGRLSAENPGLEEPPEVAHPYLEVMERQFEPFSNEDLLNMFLDILATIGDRGGMDMARQAVKIAQAVNDRMSQKMESRTLNDLQDRLEALGVRVIRIG